MVLILDSVQKASMDDSKTVSLSLGRALGDRVGRPIFGLILVLSERLDIFSFIFG